MNDFSAGRRKLLTYAVSSPVLTIAAGFAANLATPSRAEAAPLPLTPPDTVDYYDVGDSIVQTSAADDAAGQAGRWAPTAGSARPAAPRVGPGHRHRAAE